MHERVVISEERNNSMLENNPRDFTLRIEAMRGNRREIHLTNLSVSCDGINNSVLIVFFCQRLYSEYVHFFLNMGHTVPVNIA